MLNDLEALFCCIEVETECLGTHQRQESITCDDHVISLGHVTLQILPLTFTLELFHAEVFKHVEQGFVRDDILCIGGLIQADVLEKYPLEGEKEQPTDLRLHSMR